MQPPSTRRIRDRVSGQAARVLRRTRARAVVGRPRAARRRRAATTRTTAPDEAPLVDRLLRGADLGTAVLDQVRTWLESGRPDAAVGLAESLRAHDDTRALGELASAVVAFERGFTELAWARFAPLARETWAPYAAEDYTRCGLVADRDGTVRELRRVIAEEPAIVRLGDWVTLSGVAFGAGEHALAGEMFDLAEAVAAETPDRSESINRRLDWLRPWVRAEVCSTSPRRDRPVFADHGLRPPGPVRRSANIGDHVQSIASLGHLVRHQSVRFHGHEDLVGLLDPARRPRPPRRCGGTASTPTWHVLTVHRDASMYQEIPEQHLDPLLRLVHAPAVPHALRLPVPRRNLRPLFVSFHCNKRDLLTDEAIAYLKRYGPVGCRDWTTVYLLLSAGSPRSSPAA